VPQDYAEAVRWYRKAADQGIAEAQFSLGIAYANGVGVASGVGLGPAVADTSGRAAWSWNIGPSTKPGTGTVTVTCNGVGISSPITIG